MTSTSSAFYPPNAHTPVVVDVLAAGKHVLCEKPIAGTLEHADQAIDAADRYSSCRASYVYQYRSDPAHVRLRHLIQKGHLGRILMATVRVRAQRTAAYYSSRPGRGSWAMDGGGVLINQAVHQLDALVSFLGKPIEVSARMSTFLQPIESEDTMVGWIKFESGVLATIDCTVCAHEEWFSIEVLGENAQVTVRGAPSPQACTWSVQSKSSAVQRALWRTGVSMIPDLPPEPRRANELAQKAWCKLRGKQWLPPRHWGHTPLCTRIPGISGLVPNDAGSPTRGSALPRIGNCTLQLSNDRGAGEIAHRPLSSLLPRHHVPDRNGGSEVTMPRPTIPRYPSLFIRARRGLRLSGDLLRMLPWTLAGQTTITDGSGVINRFEKAFCRSGAAFALAMTNGTATLHSAYFAVGVGPGCEVIVPSYTWHASATPVLQCGATPVFCDIDPNTLTADPDDIERRITERTKAICVVHVWGNPAQMDRIMEIANRHRIAVVKTARTPTAPSTRENPSAPGVQSDASALTAERAWMRERVGLRSLMIPCSSIACSSSDTSGEFKAGKLRVPSASAI